MDWRRGATGSQRGKEREHGSLLLELPCSSKLFSGGLPQWPSKWQPRLSAWCIARQRPMRDRRPDSLTFRDGQPVSSFSSPFPLLAPHFYPPPRRNTDDKAGKKEAEWKKQETAEEEEEGEEKNEEEEQEGVIPCSIISSARNIWARIQSRLSTHAGSLPLSRQKVCLLLSCGLVWIPTTTSHTVQHLPSHAQAHIHSSTRTGADRSQSNLLCLSARLAWSR